MVIRKKIVSAPGFFGTIKKSSGDPDLGGGNSVLNSI